MASAIAHKAASAEAGGRPLHAHVIYGKSAFFFGLLFLLAMPPFQVPDEHHHFYRSYQISEAKLFSVRWDAASGGVLPESLQRVYETAAGDIAFDWHKKFTPERFQEALALPLEEQRRTRIRFPNTAIFSPVPYLPQAAGIALGRSLGAPPLLLLYMGRFCNLMASLVCILFAVRLAPVFKSLIMAVALMPMSVQQVASLSPDAMTIGLAMLWVAMILRGVSDPQFWGGRYRTVLLFAVSGMLTASKSAYFPMVFLFFILPFRSTWQRRRHIGVGLGLFAFTLLLVWACGQMAKLYFIPRIGGDRSWFEQASAFILSNPFEFGNMLVQNLAENAGFYARSFIGTLGALDTPLPVGLVGAIGGALVLIGLLDGRTDFKLSTADRLLVGMLTAACAVLIITSQYYLWTPVGRMKIGVAQGRYFIPVAPMAALLLYNSRFFRRVRCDRLAVFSALFFCSTLTAALIVVLERYYY